jgi:hypothetical protein
VISHLSTGEVKLLAWTEPANLLALVSIISDFLTMVDGQATGSLSF